MGTAYFFIVIIQAVVLQLASSQSCGDLPVNCRALDDSCLRIRCSSGNYTAWIQVSNCKDPVQVDLNVSDSIGHLCHRTYSVSESQYGELAMNGKLQLNATFNRNASHLTFAFSIHKDNLTVALLIPSIKVPLNPTECMCSSIQNAANVTRHPLPGGTHPCFPDTRCGGMYCNITFVGNIATHTTIDPCTESVQITADRFDRTFTNSEELPISGGATVYVTIHHYNYSMEVSVSLFHTFIQNFTILPLQRIILDRSRCIPFTPFPAAPVPDNLPHVVTCSDGRPGPTTANRPPGPTTVNQHGPTTANRPPGPTTVNQHGPTTVNQHGPTTTNQSGVPQQSHLALKVALPVVCIILSAVLFAVVFMVVWIVYHRYKKKREFRFQRMAFDESDDDDDNM